MSVDLLVNHPGDHRYSMHAFGRLLARTISDAGLDVRVHAPGNRFSRLLAPRRRLRRWALRFEKHAFGRALPRLCRGDVIHVTEQGNARWVNACARRTTLVTCHDLGVLEMDQPVAEVGWLARGLRGAMVEGLSRATALVAVSEFTAGVVRRLIPRCPAVQVAPLCLHTGFASDADAAVTLTQLDPRLREGGFLLHVGSNLPRKRREMVLELIAHLGVREAPQVVFAGEPLDDVQRARADELEVANRVVQVVNPDHDQLQALYSRALALVFPSRYEGFGWPILEAQACGCPIVCSPHTSLPEVVGRGGCICRSDTITEYARWVRQLREHPDLRSTSVAAGYDNSRRFSEQAMRDRYVQVYREVAGA